MTHPARDATDTLHPVLRDSHTWHIDGLCWRSLSQTRDYCVVDLLLRRGTSTTALRFLEAQTLEIEEGGPTDTGGFTILDITARGLDRLGVLVTDFEASPGAVRFWARSVHQIPTDQFGVHDTLQYSFM